ncbi:hypothetical protein GCM10023185_28310 [Hymenobacter saemangeumensis]|uniref:HTH hxlR-type domain-containing protein n=1 Tax=Hymenobacter saemangeumensis TaxID=1084522 RepID=A0ABP8IKA6_9BACT
MKPGTSPATVAEQQHLATREKIHQLFGHLDPACPPTVCPIRDVLAPVSDKWSILIVIFLGLVPTRRFNDLKRCLYGVSSKTLTERLKHLERDGYLARTVYPEVPIRVEYHLTSFGQAYLAQLLALTEWVQAAMPGILQARQAGAPHV